MKNETPSLADLIQKNIDEANALIHDVDHATRLQKNTDELLERLISANQNTRETHKLFAIRLPLDDSIKLENKMKICLKCFIEHIKRKSFNAQLKDDQQDNLDKQIKALEKSAKSLLD